jgi:hypothetical protein
VLQRRRRAQQFDPHGRNVDEVKAFVTAHPAKATTVLAAEQTAKKPRSTLVAWLQVAEQQHAAATWDPADGTVDEVVQFVTDYPDQLDRVRATEAAGDARVTLLNELLSRVEAREAAASAQNEQPQ